MLATLKARRDREEGFTLIELMVVVLIIAILIAIAIPTFLGARERAQERAAQSSARNALTAAKTLFTDDESYTNVDDVTMADVEPSLTYGATAGAASTGQNEISWVISDNTAGNDDAVITLAVKSKNGKCFYLRSVEIRGTVTPGAYYGEDTAASCSASTPAALSTTGW